MKSPINSIIRQAARKKDDKYNILTVATHEGYQSAMSQTHAEYYFFFTKGLKRWRDDYRELPSNCHILPDDSVPSWIDFDICLSQSKFGQFQTLQPLAAQLHIPLIHAEHTDRLPSWSDKDVESLKSLRATKTYFITDYSRKRWGYSEEEAGLIPHGVDSTLFYPDYKIKRSGILTVANDFINRGPLLGFDLWKSLVKGLPVNLVGDTPPFSYAAQNVEELVRHYQKASVYLNTAPYSPVPTAVLESAAAGCALVSTNTCAIPDIFTHEYDALLSNNESELRKYLELLVNDHKFARQLGENARKTVMEKFNLAQFVQNWNNIFDEAANIVYTGE